MIKITSLWQASDNLLLIVAGDLTGPWAEELASAVTRALDSAPSHLAIDAAGISAIDSDGTELLHRLLDYGVVIQAASTIVVETLYPS